MLQCLCLFVRFRLPKLNCSCYDASWSLSNGEGRCCRLRLAHTQTRSPSSPAAEKEVDAFKTVMKPPLWWIGSHWRVCHLAWLTLPLDLPLCLPVRMADDSGGHRGTASAQRSSICCPPWRIPPLPSSSPTSCISRPSHCCHGKDSGNKARPLP